MFDFCLPISVFTKKVIAPYNTTLNSMCSIDRKTWPSKVMVQMKEEDNMKKLLLIVLALGITQANAAPTYTYMCKDHGRKVPVKIDETKNTLTWKGTVYSIKVKEDCGRYGWHAEKDGVGFDFCTATQGVADFELNGVSYDCDMKR